MVDQAAIHTYVEDHFVSGELNCAMTVLGVLSQHFEVPTDTQVFHAAQAVPGAGGVGDLCGLVTGVLMFLGVWAGQYGIPRAALRPVSSRFVTAVHERWGSIQCHDLKERGCPALAEDLLAFAVSHLEPALASLLASS